MFPKSISLAIKIKKGKIETIVIIKFKITFLFFKVIFASIFCKTHNTATEITENNIEIL